MSCFSVRLLRLCVFFIINCQNRKLGLLLMFLKPFMFDFDPGQNIFILLCFVYLRFVHVFTSFVTRRVQKCETNHSDSRLCFFFGFDALGIPRSRSMRFFKGTIIIFSYRRVTPRGSKNQWLLIKGSIDLRYITVHFIISIIQ